MDLYIDRNELIQGLSRVQGIVERRSTNMALSHVLLSADGECLRMTATDTMLSLVGEYVARIETEGELTVDAQGFFQIAKSLPAQTVHLQSVAGNRLAIKSGSAEFHMVGLSAEDYPPLPGRDESMNLQIPGSNLKKLIEETIFAVSADDNRYGLNGAHWEEITSSNGEARIRVVTTDGSRLAYSEASYDGDFGMGRRMLLPRKALAEIRKLCETVAGRSENDAIWEIGFGERSATFSTTGLTLMVRLIDGDFPDYRQVLPNGLKRKVTVDQKALIDALRRVAIVASDRNHSVRFVFEPDALVLTAQNVDMGDAREEIPIELDGEPMYTGFNVRYFQDILSAVKSEKLEIHMGESLDPCVVKLPDRDDCLFVVMPMRLD